MRDASARKVCVFSSLTYWPVQIDPSAWHGISCARRTADEQAAVKSASRVIKRFFDITLLSGDQIIA